MEMHRLVRKSPDLDWRKHTQHPNTATKLKSVWLFVESLIDSIRIFEHIGFRRGSFVPLSRFGARGCEIEANGCSILLVEPADERGLASRFLRDHGQSFAAVSIEVGDFERARDYVEIKGDMRLQPYAGTYGRSIMVPSESAHGMWIELFQSG
jgi:4-hydroxyphenylpyruvate dioxygenase-like putative hemolysin